MKRIFLFIAFSLLSLGAWANTCEGVWDVHKKLRSENLQGVKLSGKVMHQIEFWQSFFRGADLQKANLSMVSFESVDLTGTDLRWADLVGVRFQKADLTGTDLRWADLRQSDLQFAILIDTDLRWAKLNGANFNWSKWSGVKVTKEQAEYLTAQGLSGFVVVK